jgi:hypothetical protein
MNRCFAIALSILTLTCGALIWRVSWINRKINHDCFGDNRGVGRSVTGLHSLIMLQRMSPLM